MRFLFDVQLDDCLHIGLHGEAVWLRIHHIALRAIGDVVHILTRLQVNKDVALTVSGIVADQSTIDCGNTQSHIVHT